MSVRFAYRGAAAARFAGLSSEAAPSEGRFGVAVAVFFMEKGMAALVYREAGGSRKQQGGVEGRLPTLDQQQLPNNNLRCMVVHGGAVMSNTLPFSHRSATF